MESLISSMVKRFEAGGLTRRELVQGLAMLAAGAASAAAPGTAAAQTAPAPIPWSPLIDHIQINSRDPRKAAEFYQKVMGLELLRVGPAGPDRNCCPDRDAFLGVGKRLVLAIRRREPYGVIDHWSMLAPGYNQEQFRAAITARGGSEAKHELGGQYVQDPDGVLCQLMGAPGAP
ncbi:MAG: VOC family protein [Acidimicrobiia bacterium]|nr:VOC family protein [Acidimicrobiia bacterium]